MGTPINFRAHDANNEFTCHVSGAEIASINGPDMENRGAPGVRLFLNITAASGTLPTLDVKVQVKDPVSDVYVDLPGAAFAQKIAAGSDELTIYPGVTAAANRAVSTALSTRWRVVQTIAGTGPSFTYTIGGGYIV